MRVAMTLVVRDEVDLVGDWLRYHLARGIDQVIVTDHRSVDGTSEVLAEHARDGRVRVIREEAPDMRQAEWVTRMARLAATEHGADWVINSDADEFWWPRDGGAHELLGAVPRALRRRPGALAAVRPAARRADVVRRADDRPLPPRPGLREPVPRAGQDRAPRAARRRRQRGQSRRVRRRADADPRVAPVRGAALPASRRGAGGGQVPPPPGDPRRRAHRRRDPAARLRGAVGVPRRRPVRRPGGGARARRRDARRRRAPAGRARVARRRRHDRFHRGRRRSPTTSIWRSTSSSRSSGTAGSTSTGARRRWSARSRASRARRRSSEPAASDAPRSAGRPSRYHPASFAATSTARGAGR